LTTELLLVADNFSKLLDSAFCSGELDDSISSLLDDNDSSKELLEDSLTPEVGLEEDEFPCSSALLRVAGSLFSADADNESSHAAKNAIMLNVTKIFFIKILRPNGSIYPVNNITFFTPPVHFM
jgi:hypothetical protein